MTMNKPKERAGGSTRAVGAHSRAPSLPAAMGSVHVREQLVLPWGGGMANTAKRRNGVFYTRGNPFTSTAFREWAAEAALPRSTILEPFAGSNSLINTLRLLNLCHKYHSYDISPTASDVEVRDTLADFPTGHDVCVTNPPWLARNSATVRGMDFPDTRHDDLYKFALEKCLEHCSWVAALIPESFICAGLFQSRLSDFISLTGRMFEDTGHPVGFALFRPESSKDVRVWRDDEYIGHLSRLESIRPGPLPDGVDVRFNEPDGNVGLIALDNTLGPSIRFCDVRELADYEVKPTGRHITKMWVEGSIRIEAWNEHLKSFREKTSDVLMTSYKGIRKDGMYRRRLDWKLARGIIHHA